MMISDAVPMLDIFWKIQSFQKTHLFAGRLLRKELPLMMKNSSKMVSEQDDELLAVCDLLLDDLEDTTNEVEASLDDFDTKWASWESTDIEVGMFWKENYWHLDISILSYRMKVNQ